MFSFILVLVKGLINTHFSIIMTTDVTSNHFRTASYNSSEVTLGNEQEFLMVFSINLILALTAIIGNGLVLYSTTKSINLGALRNLDAVIKSLAMADLLYGLLGVPSNIINYYYLSKYCGFGHRITNIV